MECSRGQEHVLHENPYIAQIEQHLASYYPDRLEHVNSIDTAVIAAGMQEVEARYGAESDVPLEYHNQRHTWEAFEDYCVYADIFRLSDQQFTDGAIAIAWHDWEQLRGSGANERESALNAQRVMDSAGYSIDRQQSVANYILATEVETDGQGRLMQKHLMTFGPDKALLAVAMADMYGITLRGEETMVRHAYRLACEFGRVSFVQLAKDPTVLIRMFDMQYPYVGDRLDMLTAAVQFHVAPYTEAERVLTDLQARFGSRSSTAIRAAKSIHEGIAKKPEEAARLVKEWAERASNETAFLDGLARYATKLALGRGTHRASETKAAAHNSEES